MRYEFRASLIPSLLLVAGVFVLGYYYGLIRDIVPQGGLKLVISPLWLAWGTFVQIVTSAFVSFVAPPVCPLTWWLVHLVSTDRENVPLRQQAAFLLPPAIVSLCVPLWGVYRFYDVPEYQSLPWHDDLLSVALQVTFLALASSGLLVYTSKSWRQFRKYGFSTLGLIAINTLTTFCMVHLGNH